MTFYTGDGPHRSAPLTPPPKMPFNWKPVLELFFGCLFFVGILMAVGGFFAFVIAVGDNIETGENTRARRTERDAEQCMSFCEEERYQYWGSRRRSEADTIDCVCARPETHRSQRFLCRVPPDSPIVCVYN